MLNPGILEPAWKSLQNEVDKARRSLIMAKSRGHDVAKAQRRFDAAKLARETAIAQFIEADGNKTRKAIADSTQAVIQDAQATRDEFRQDFKDLKAGNDEIQEGLHYVDFTVGEVDDKVEKLLALHGETDINNPSKSDAEILLELRAKKQRDDAAMNTVRERMAAHSRAAKEQQQREKAEKAKQKAQKPLVLTPGGSSGSGDPILPPVENGKVIFTMEELDQYIQAKIQQGGPRAKVKATPTVPEGLPGLPDLSLLKVVEDFITEEEAQLILAAEVQEVPARGHTLKRAPKCEYYVGDSPIWYSFQQEKKALELQKPMPQWMQEMGGRLPDAPQFNHGLIIRYSDAMQHFAPRHQDHSEDTGGKTACLKKGTGFYNISVGKPRLFQFSDADGNVVKEFKLPHRSLLHVPAEYNAAYWHAVPKDSTHKGVRCSLIFRDILIPAPKVGKRKAAEIEADWDPKIPDQPESIEIDKGSFKRSGPKKQVQKIVDAYDLLSKDSGDGPIQSFGKPNQWLEGDDFKEVHEEAISIAKDMGIIFVPAGPDATQANIDKVKPANKDAEEDAEEEDAEEEDGEVEKVEPPVKKARKQTDPLKINMATYYRKDKDERVELIGEFYKRLAIINNGPVHPFAEPNAWLKATCELEEAMGKAAEMGITFVSLQPEEAEERKEWLERMSE